MYPFISVLGFSLPSYGLCSLVGIGAAALYISLTNRGKRCGYIKGEDLLYVGLLAFVGVVIGGKAMGVLSSLPLVVRYWAKLIQQPALLLSLLFGSFVFYGGLIGGLAGAYWFCRRYKISFKTVVGIVAPAIPLFHVFGRIGCFFAGCCYGIPVSWGVVFTHQHVAPTGVALLPIQLIEAGGNFILFVVLALVVRRLQRKWMILPLYLVAYACMRFVLEFFRGDIIRGVVLLSTSQWVSLLILVVVGVLYFARWRKQTNAQDVEETPLQQGDAAESAAEK